MFHGVKSLALATHSDEIIGKRSVVCAEEMLRREGQVDSSITRCSVLSEVSMGWSLPGYSHYGEMFLLKEARQKSALTVVILIHHNQVTTK